MERAHSVLLILFIFMFLYHKKGSTLADSSVFLLSSVNEVSLIDSVGTKLTLNMRDVFAARLSTKDFAEDVVT